MGSWIQFNPFEQLARSGGASPRAAWWIGLAGTMAGNPLTAGEALAGKGATTVIGKLKDIQSLAAGEQTLLELLPDLGSVKANWAQNAGVLRAEMSLGQPIRDASVDASGQLIQYPGSFLNAERNLLTDRRWTYNPSTTYWNPPK